MNKEVILEIKRSLASAAGFDRNDLEATFIDIEARDLYKRIASHLRTNKRECTFCLGTGECQGGDGCHSKIHNCPICKGIGIKCPTCEGSGEKCTLLSDSHSIHSNCDMQPCPDCKPKEPMFTRDNPDKHIIYGNERKGQQRQSFGRRYWEKEPSEGYPTWVIDTLGRRLKDRRDTKEKP